MKKILIIAMTFALIFTAALSVYADGMTPKSIGTMLAEIQTAQGVQSPEKINPDKVSQAMLEELGDSVMEAMLGNTALHDKMDNSLGGDSSAALTTYHARIGYNYLVGYPNGMMALMTAGLLIGNHYPNSGGMMGYLGFGGIIMIFATIALFYVILFFIMKAFIRKPAHIAIESPLDILKRRYASGEINKEEYERMLEHLKA